MEDFLKNVATTESEINEQKAQIQEEVEVGETAASIAAKVPLSTETIIEGIQEGYKLSELASRYAVEILVLLFSFVVAAMAYEVLS